MTMKRTYSGQWLSTSLWAVLLLLPAPEALAQSSPSQNQNYLITFTPKTPISDITQLAGTTAAQVNQTIQYFDGLGRPVQTVQWQASPNQRDLVQPIAYDQYGRESTKYLPYANHPSVSSDGSYKADAITQQGNFYSSPWAADIAPTAYPVAQTNFEPSPLNRPLEQGAPGQAWQLGGHTAGITYSANAASEVMLWHVNGSGAAWDSYYNANTLYKTTTTDENGHSSIEYKDLLGHVVCKMAQGPNGLLATYYVYDDYNNLAYVIPPIPAGTTYPGSFVETDAVFLNYIYGYHYDSRNRQTEKKIPGKGWDFMIYNTLDQVIFTQDADQRALNAQVWTYIQYDAQGRVAITGLWNSAGASGSGADANIASPGHTLQQWLLNWAAAQTTLWLSRNNSTATGYTALDPQGTVLTINYYDDYNFTGYPYGPWNSGTLSAPTGLPTATKTTVLNPDGSYGDPLWTVYHYDDKGRVAQTSKQHYLGGHAAYSTGNYDVVINGYNFDNSISNATRWHIVNNVVALTVANAYYYDPAGRRLQNYEAFNSAASVLLSQSDYNETGQLMTKHLHNAGSGFLQDISYAYNERGWLTSQSSSKFNLTLAYNTNITTGATPQYNGNIAEMYSTSDHTAGNSKMKYTYDALNRLIAADHTNGQLTENGITYDEMGNILSLNRSGASAAGLTYAYAGNQLTTVLNNGAAFRNYSYDPNGNATTDGTTKNISYNLLNLPGTVSQSGSTLATYTYDAGGVKLANTGSDGNWDYDNGIVYHNSAIAFVQTEEGRAIPNGGSYSYQYNLKDHLGNDRVSMDNTGVLQEDEYYAFGLRNPQYDNSNNNRYLYNGKEIQTDLTNQYDYGARFYDPVIARWTNPDNHAEKYFEWSPYIYVYNDPLKNIDPDGNDGVKIVDKENHTITVKANYYVPTIKNNKDDNMVGYSAKDIRDLNQLYKSLNEKSFTVSEGEFKGYSVKFDMEFKDAGTTENATKLSENDKIDGTSIGNTFTVGDGYAIGYFFPKEIENADGTTSTLTIGGVTDKHKTVTMNSRKDTRRNEIHETWHTLFFDNDDAKEGIGSYDRIDMPNQNDINKLINNNLLPSTTKEKENQNEKRKQ